MQELYSKLLGVKSPMEEVLENIERRIKVNSRNEAAMILSLLPASFNPHKMKTKLKVSHRLAEDAIALKNGKQLQERKLPSHALSDEVKSSVKSFFTQKEHIYTFPGCIKIFYYFPRK